MRRSAFAALAPAHGHRNGKFTKLSKHRGVVFARAGANGARVSTAALLIAVPLLWGSYPTAVKKFLDAMPPLLVNAGDVGFAAIFATVAARGQYSGIPERVAAAELAAYLFLASTLNVQALVNLSASRATFWVQLTSVFVPAGATLQGEPLHPALPPAAFLAALGAGVIARDSAAAPFGLADLAGVAAALCYSAHALRLEMLTRSGAVAPRASLVRDTYVVESGMVLAVAAAAALRPGDVADYVAALPTLNGTDVIAAAAGILWIGVATSALATWAQVAGQARVGPSRAAVVYSAQPVCAMITAYIVGVETPTVNEIIGGILISLAAVIATNIGGERKIDMGEHDA